MDGKQPWEMSREEFISFASGHVARLGKAKTLYVVIGPSMYGPTWAGVKDQRYGRFTRPLPDVFGDLHESIVEGHLSSLERAASDLANPYTPPGLKSMATARLKEPQVSHHVLSHYPVLAKRAKEIQERLPRLSR